MDFYMKQWRDQHHESDYQQQPKTITTTTPPTLSSSSSSCVSGGNTQSFLFQNQYHQQHKQKQQEQEAACCTESESESALPLFVPEPLISIKSSISSSVYPDSVFPIPRLPRMGGYFSLAQMQELELQALIYRHMVAGAAVPHELLHLVKKSLINSPHNYFLQHNNYPYYHPNWYWGRASMDPEPGRCRRTDGKKWRCSRDAVEGQKYCERHIHRGRNRSRKPVEFPTSTTVSSTIPGGGDAGASAGSIGGLSGGSGAAFSVASATSSGTHFSLSGAAAAMDMFQLNQGLTSESTPDKRNLFEPQREPSSDGNSSNRVLRCFFDAWPRSSDHMDNSSDNLNPSLSIATPRNPSSDFLRLSTGNNGHEPEGHRSMNWWGGSSNHVATVGGPLAEALRSSTSSSPTNSLHQMQHGSASDTSFVIG